MPQFHETVGGHRFFEGQLPRLIKALERIGEAAEKVAPAPKRDNFGTHLSHCNFGEHPGVCKYGDEDCPALTDDWRWFGDALTRRDEEITRLHAALDAAVATGRKP